MLSPPPSTLYVKIGKRLLDLFLVLVSAIVWVPLLMVVALFVRLKLGSPVLFRQTRIGLEGKPFTLLKFRTMTDAVDANGEALSDDLRMTTFGSFLRKSSIDELPSLLLVLRGQMSLVGPRPLLVDYLDLYSQQQLQRHNVLPGITGWAQINGRNAIAWHEKFEKDVWYVENVSLILDMKILMMTVIKVLRREDTSATNHVTSGRFDGTN